MQSAQQPSQNSYYLGVNGVLSTRPLDLGDLLSKTRSAIAHLCAVRTDHALREKVTQLTISKQKNIENEEWMESRVWANGCSRLQQGPFKQGWIRAKFKEYVNVGISQNPFHLQA